MQSLSALASHQLKQSSRNCGESPRAAMASSLYHKSAVNAPVHETRGTGGGDGGRRGGGCEGEGGSGWGESGGGLEGG